MNIKKILDSGIVKRYHTCDTIKEQNTASHQWGVAMICHALKPDCSKDMLIYALMHDAAEKVTGDIPAIVKRLYLNSYQFKEHVKNLETAFCSLPELSHFELAIIRIADILELIWFIDKEIRMGNGNEDILSCFNNGKQILKERIEEISILEYQGKDIGNAAETLFTNFTGVKLW
jgi:5'-deoxynucleotidase YfbR-like HD superfamily hydrolase